MPRSQTEQYLDRRARSNAYSSVSSSSTLSMRHPILRSTHMNLDCSSANSASNISHQNLWPTDISSNAQPNIRLETRYTAMAQSQYGKSMAARRQSIASAFV